MKRVAYFIFLIFVLSCGSSHLPAEENRITLLYRDSTIERESFYLLSVRNETLIVAPAFEDMTIDSIISLARVVPFTKIETIIYSSDPDLVLPGLGGCVAGMVAGAAIGGSIPIKTHQEFDLSNIFTGGLIGGGVGLATGLILAQALSNSEKQLLLDSRMHISEARQLAIFRVTEPPELQKIK
jgi:hypothetical protein